MRDIERVRQVYNGRYKVDLRDLSYMWHPRNRVSLLFTHILQWELIWALNRLNIELVDRDILDVGCGYGRMLRFWSEMGADPCRVSGIDLMFYRLYRAVELSPRMRICSASAADLPFSDASFDLISQFSVFSSIHDETLRHEAAKEMIRVLRPGGWLIWYDLASVKSEVVWPLPKTEVIQLLNGLNLMYSHSIFTSQLGRILSRSPLLAVVWEYLSLDRRSGELLIFQLP